MLKQNMVRGLKVRSEVSNCDGKCYIIDFKRELARGRCVIGKKYCEENGDKATEGYYATNNQIEPWDLSEQNKKGGKR